MRTKTCEQCGKEYTRVKIASVEKFAKQKYCSRACLHLGRKKQVELTCERCGKVFSLCRSMAKRNTRFCSMACRSTVAEYPCEYCRKPYRIKASSAHLRSTCSRSCAASLRAKNGRSPNQGRVRTEIEKIRVSEGLRRYYAGDPTKHWNYRGGPGPSRGSSWPKQRALARERDGNQCQACLITETEYDKKMPVHHIVPYREFATHQAANHLDNLICLCQSCHMKMEHGTLSLLIRRECPIETIPIG